METIEKKFIVDEKNRKIAVQIPIETYEKIEEILEDYALGQLMKESKNEEPLSKGEAKEFYEHLEKA